MNLQGKRILIVDDQSALRSMLEQVLRKDGLEPVSAASAKQAQELLKADRYDMVVSDIKMPDMDGLQLLRWIKAVKPLPVILMTGFSEILETDEAARVGADAFLPKPFRRDDLITAIEECLAGQAAGASRVENIDDRFCKIAIEEFVFGRQIKFDIYVRISERQYVKIAHGGENITADRIETYREKGVSYLYMTREDFREYLAFSQGLASAVTAAPGIDSRKKAGVVRHATEVFLKNVCAEGIGKEEFQQAASIVENAVRLVTDDAQGAELLTLFSGHSDTLFSHSVGVCFYSCLIGRSLGWGSSSTMFKLAMGGLLHDIGKKEIPRDILEKPRCLLSSAEVSLLETHPTRGAEILRGLAFVPEEVVQIVHEHHENCLGSGYPARLKKGNIYPPARLVAVADAFVHQLVGGPVKLAPAEAFKNLQKLDAEYLDPVMVEALWDPLESTCRHASLSIL